MTANDSHEEACPVCKNSAIVTKKWVLNNRGRKYSYLLYHHNGSIHYRNQSPSNSRSRTKGEIRRMLIEIINSEAFNEGLFSAEDARRMLSAKGMDVPLDSVRENLYGLQSTGMVEAMKKDRKVLFINSAFRERLSFIDESIRFVLRDIDDDQTFRNHISITVVRNDKRWPLYYIPYKIYGDSDVKFEEIQFSARDISNNQSLKHMLIEDRPKEKRLLIKLATPLPPNESVKVKFEYDWGEPRREFFFTAATHMKSFGVVLMSKSPLRLHASTTSQDLNEIEDVSGLVVRKARRNWGYVYSLIIGSIKPFSIVQLRWEHPIHLTSP